MTRPLREAKSNFRISIDCGLSQNASRFNIGYYCLSDAMVKMMTGHQKMILIVSALVATSAHSDDCRDAYEIAYEAFTHASNGYKSISLKDAQEHAAKAHKELNNVMSTADECGCSDAVKTAGTAYRFASAAYDSNDHEAAIAYLRKSADSARKAMSNAIDCSGY